jgi:GTP-binding protein EngB required for normal cell division
MTVNDLQSKDHRDLLDIIDQLRSQGFSRYVDLPEIIVCGDQSAGKSSVLEAISGMSFPTKDNVCTRFATELILRRHPTKSVKISITPGDDRYQQEKDILQGWQPQGNVEDIGLESVVEEAKSIMGLTSSKIFSNDILRVELSGPTQPHLTMVDLPGLFRAGNKEQSADNVELVKQMVTRYMERPRSIILAVVSAKNEYVLQDVTEFASKADPQGLRTMGLITKPDTLDEGSDSERSWVRLASNEDVELTLGWHVLKNRSYEQRDFTSAQRDEAEEKFFSRGAWARMDPGLCGVKSLKSRLSTVLKEQILKQLPSLVADVEHGIEGCNAKLARLGDARESPEQQQVYLMRISDGFTNLMTAAIEGNYSNPFFRDVEGLDGYEKRLRAVVQNRLDAFQMEMRDNGQSLFIVDDDDEQTYGDRSISRSEFVEQVKHQMSHRRGCELPGLFKPDIINDLFAAQCQPWRGIAADMTQEILDSVYRATRRIVKQTAADDVAEKLLMLLNTRIEQYERNVEGKVEELLRSHYAQHPITYNHQLTENVQRAQQARRRRTMEKRIADTFRDQMKLDITIHITPTRIMDLFFDEVEQDMRRYGSSLAVDYMEAYYKASIFPSFLLFFIFEI